MGCCSLGTSAAVHATGTPPLHRSHGTDAGGGGGGRRRRDPHPLPLARLAGGEATLCLEGQSDRFQPYVWAGLLSFEGMGPVDSSGFTGEGSYPSGGGQVEGTGPEESLPAPPSGLRAVPGLMLLCLGLLEFTRRTTSISLRWGLSVPGLVLILLGGVFNPLISASTAVQAGRCLRFGRSHR